jgi:hypothetical protein
MRKRANPRERGEHPDEKLEVFRSELGRTLESLNSLTVKSAN